METSWSLSVKFAALLRIPVNNCSYISFAIVFSIAAPRKNVLGLSSFDEKALRIRSNVKVFFHKLFKYMRIFFIVMMVALTSDIKNKLKVPECQGYPYTVGASVSQCFLSDPGRVSDARQTDDVRPAIWQCWFRILCHPQSGT